MPGSASVEDVEYEDSHGLLDDSPADDPPSDESPDDNVTRLSAVDPAQVEPESSPDDGFSLLREDSPVEFVPLPESSPLDSREPPADEFIVESDREESSIELNHEDSRSLKELTDEASDPEVQPIDVPSHELGASELQFELSFLEESNVESRDEWSDDERGVGQDSENEGGGPLVDPGGGSTDGNVGGSVTSPPLLGG